MATHHTNSRGHTMATFAFLPVTVQQCNSASAGQPRGENYAYSSYTYFIYSCLPCSKMVFHLPGTVITFWHTFWIIPAWRGNSLHYYLTWFRLFSFWFYIWSCACTHTHTHTRTHTHLVDSTTSGDSLSLSATAFAFFLGLSPDQVASRSIRVLATSSSLAPIHRPVRIKSAKPSWCENA